MKVVIDNKIPEVRILRVGDIVEKNGDFFLVAQFEDKYVCKTLTGMSGLHGSFNSMDALNREFQNRSSLNAANIYRKEDYQLKLEVIK
jgi:hypothetical protein